MRLHIGPKFTEVLVKKVVLSTMSGVMGLFHVIVTYATQQKNRGFNGKGMINLHGHIHQNPSPEGPYKCVCVEQPHMNYTPMNIEELRQ